MGEAVMISHSFIKKLETAIAPRLTSMTNNNRGLWLTIVVNVDAQWSEDEEDMIRLVRDHDEEGEGQRV